MLFRTRTCRCRHIFRNRRYIFILKLGRFILDKSWRRRQITAFARLRLFRFRTKEFITQRLRARFTCRLAVHLGVVAVLVFILGGDLNLKTFMRRRTMQVRLECAIDIVMRVTAIHRRVCRWLLCVVVVVACGISVHITITITVIRRRRITRRMNGVATTARSAHGNQMLLVLEIRKYGIRGCFRFNVDVKIVIAVALGTIAQTLA
mmetsp:Transcript_16411/g.25297  ORF Transcript_16411/g.25297 Transcript_16411/m.25297 type:complete len:206 (-) Transcript_16411:1014-1631(-)